MLAIGSRAPSCVAMVPVIEAEVDWADAKTGTNAHTTTTAAWRARARDMNCLLGTAQM
jgi:hypothetical protein